MEILQSTLVYSTQHLFDEFCEKTGQKLLCFSGILIFTKMLPIILIFKSIASFFSYKTWKPFNLILILIFLVTYFENQNQKTVLILVTVERTK